MKTLFGFMLGLSVILTSLTGHAAVTNIWTGGGADNNASTAGNWSLGVAPSGDHHIVLDGRTNKNLTWESNAVHTVASWTQAGYHGTVTVVTVYGNVGFTNFTITGNCVISNGVLTHRANTGGENATDRLRVTIGGDFILGANAAINLDGRGYRGYQQSQLPGSGLSTTAIYGPGRGDFGGRADARSAMHGGRGALNLETSGTYGSATRPQTLGSGARESGGGALFMEVDGEAVIDGVVSADGLNVSVQSDRLAPGSGGSIYLRAGSLKGAGTLRASIDLINDCRVASGGGRVALIANNTAVLDDLTVRADTHTKTTYGIGRAGTVYIETPDSRRLIVDQDNIGTAPSANATELPSELGPHDNPPAGFSGELADTTLIMTNRAFVRLTGSLRMDDITWIGSDCVLDLNGHTLYLKVDEPVNFPADFGGGTIEFNDGAIVWGNVAAVLELQVEVAIDRGTLSADPPMPPDGLYDVGTDVELTIVDIPSGYAFARWEGDIPDGTDPTTHPLTINMDGSRYLRAIVADADANTRTWVALGADANADTDANWYPPAAPVSGQHVVFEAVSDNCSWNLDIEPASWNQIHEYAGTVTFDIFYPGQGLFTEFTITGDCVISNGIWEHTPNPAVHDEVNRLNIAIGGNLTIGPDGSIDVSEKGYRGQHGPGRSNLSGYYGGSHGGRGGDNYVLGNGQCYGSVVAPTNLGGASYAATGHGGGAIKLRVTGTIYHDGSIKANGSLVRYGSGAGGSIFLTAGELTGDGTIEANSTGTDLRRGGGGRIALVATNQGAVIHSFIAGSNVLAYPVNNHSSGGAHHAGAGTIYMQSGDDAPGYGTVYVALNNQSVDPGYTDIGEPTLEGSTPHLESQADAAAAATFRVSDGAILHLTSDTKVGDIWLDTANATLDLNHHTLTVNSSEHDLGPGRNNVWNEGAIAWLQIGTLIMIR